jgi:hypothetical protein
MDVLATRVLSYLDDNGNDSQLILTIFTPFKAKEYQWKCAFVFGQPIDGKVEYGVGIDFIQAFLNCVQIARGYFEGTELFGRCHWQGMLDCGLPWHTANAASLGPDDIPLPDESAESMDVLTIRAVGYRDESGEREFLLTVFVPFKAEDEVWKCGFTFDPPPSATIRYGVGADSIEALLDGLAKARATFEGTAPKGWKPSEEAFDCNDFPYKIGRSFWTERAREPPPGMPDFFGDAELAPNKP